jgi:hypothetical protein
MRLLSVLMGVLISSVSQGFDHSHSLWDGELKKYLNQAGLVHYNQWSKSAATLDEYLKNLAAVKKSTFNKWTIPQQKAFLVNAYNAFTIKLILKNYPVKSIKKIGGFFTKPWSIEFFNLLGGEITSLDPIEHVWLRGKKEYKDPRIHAAVNCASISCPQLLNEAFVADKIDKQLDTASHAWVSDPRRNEFDRSKGLLRLSKIFSWFEDDFGGDDQGVIEFLIKYSSDDLAKYLSKNKLKLEIEYLDYDWNLNQAK